MAQTISPPRPSLEDPEPRPLLPAPSRGTVRARDAFVTIVVALALWALLFAPVLEKDAEGAPLGARRTVALAVLRPLTNVSEKLGFDRASDLALRVVGRDLDAPPGGELDLPEIDLPPAPPVAAPSEPPPRPEHTSPSPDAPQPSSGPSAEESTGGGATAGGEPTTAIRPPTGDAKLRVAVVGDSLSQGLGPAIAEALDPDVTRVLPLGRQSTGLARQDYFNWQAAMRQLETEFRPDLVFVQLGTNDQQSQIASNGDEVEMGSAAWGTAYRARVDAFLREATSNGTRVVWVGIPVVAEHQRWDFYRHVNSIYRAAAESDPLATYVDAWKLFENREGSYSAYLRNERGVLQEMRAADGLHMTPTGYDYLARVAVRAAATAFDLPQRAVAFPI
jgi:hypothetical protein